MDWFKLSLQLNKFPVNQARKMLDEIERIPEEDYQNFIAKKKREIVNYHLKNNEFYENFIGDRSIENWEDIPIMTKKDLQTPLNDRLSKGFNLKNTYIGKTSGSSGHPFAFAKDKLCHAFTWSVIERCYSHYNISLENSRQARFYGIPYDILGYCKGRLKDLLSNRYRFPVFDLSDVMLEKYLVKLQKQNFEYIYGYTSAILLFAKFLDKKGITLKDKCSKLKLCITTSEILFQEDKKIIEKSFGLPVINEYGASELDIIAFQNRENDWRINEETLFVEVLDENNRALPLGKKGKLVITSLYNRAHPFIRYEIGDVGTLSEKSKAKHTILKELTGRTSDVVLLPSGKKAAGLSFYYVTKSIIENDGNVKEFVIHQKSLDSFKVLYVANQTLSEKKKQQIKDKIKTYLEPNLQITFEKKEELKRSKSGKLKQFSSFVNN
ncbi:phenylacetate--CoA ligase family protein [Zunongwangia endophytica]|uniref:Phenylacetate--CoA ligase family protein n=1 Tax=Zunongwangia endophytica TaxID=1808945 RepID=A0ABV8H769_9FLAO|nr:phenylacetate--CoA ligase family protein [Zunongwangia endophytica]MDN3595898.1 phenylacetate--CoA ligase family protein [Zunongwangia endophytica]